MYLAITRVTPLSDYQLELVFENQEIRLFDVKPYLDLGQFQQLKDPRLFNTVHVSFDTIEWANQLDLDPELLYQKSIPAHNAASQ